MAHPLTLQLALFKEHQQIWRPNWPSRRPNDRFSPQYCLWLAKSPQQRAEVLYRQKYRCWECGYLLATRWLHMHHPNGYANLGYEEASDLVAVHAVCHRRIHERLRLERGCGCAPMLAA